MKNRPDILLRVNTGYNPKKGYTKFLASKLGKTLKALTVVIVFTLTTFLVGWALVSGYNKSVEVYCKSLLRQSVVYKDAGFFVTQADYDQCSAHNIMIYAKVLKYDHTN